MIATVVNVALVLVGSVLGLLFRRFISQKMVSVLTHALGLCVAGIAINMLGLGREKIKVGNMLPAMFLPLVYFPISHVIGSLVS